jgi:putative redox protein
MEANVKWVSGMTFKSLQDGHELMMDLPVESGGGNTGPKPKTLLLTALGGCTGLDVVSILQKMRVELAGFEMRLSAEQTDGEPKVFKGIHVKYVFWGEALPMEKLQRAVNLSQERYCGVTAMLAKACPVTHEIVVNPA